MSRAPRNPGTGKRPHNGPARGNAGDKPASGIPAQGGGLSPSRNQMNAGLTVDLDARKDFAAEAFGKYIEILRDTEAGAAAQLAAATAILNRVEGAPLQKGEIAGKDGKALFPSLAVTIGRILDAE